jgi:glycosyltransferase involved in cell wall biosynthesis
VSGPLALFFTRGMSLRAWDERGILGRETALYRALAPHTGGVAFLTYGGPEDDGYAAGLPGITVHPNRRGLPRRAYNQALPLVHRDVLRRASVLKTNQVYGGLAAVRAARLHRRPLVARCGFLWTEFVEGEHGPRSLRTRFAADREGRLFRAADAVVVTTGRLADRVAERHGVPRGRIAVVPNYVDTAAFAAPPDAVREPGALVAIGRLSREKNLAALLEALAGLPGASLRLVGEGPEREALERRAGELGVDARFLGRVPHEELPALLAGAEAFVMPSLYEGHPKALVEAMACGLPVVATDVPGIRDVIEDGRTGVLAEPAPAALRAALERVLGDPGLRGRLGAAAAEEAAALSVQRIAERELELLDAVRRRA